MCGIEQILSLKKERIGSFFSSSTWNELSKWVPTYKLKWNAGISVLYKFFIIFFISFFQLFFSGNIIHSVKTEIENLVQTIRCFLPVLLVTFHISSSGQKIIFLLFLQIQFDSLINRVRVFPLSKNNISSDFFVSTLVHKLCKNFRYLCQSYFFRIVRILLRKLNGN